MQVDRLITLGVMQRWRRRPAKGFPVLMYHRLASDAEPGVAPWRRLCTSAERFAQQMQWLADAGWRGVGVSEALADEPDDGDGRRCAITFDDGFREIFTTAAPILRRHGFRATTYLPTAFIANKRARFQSLECLTWSEVRALHEDRFEFGSHTVTHRRLRSLPWAEVWRELVESKSRIEAELRAPIGGYSHPYAFPQADPAFTAALCCALRSLGYSHGVTTVIGRAADGDNPFALKRLPISSADDQDLFLAKLQGAYDWVARPQSWAKTARFAVTGRL